ncbi:MAG TPA: CocE/NonD family hydrolase [Thermoleophilaceae bacterium]|jgi:predicted acyl esterase|nr:CocE/NonD family hydrolase [Thermoleophilaceae bacterium]
MEAGVPDYMLIERDVAIEADDGLVLRADIFRPKVEGEYPVLLSYGPYGKGLAFQEGYADQWNLLVSAHPEVLEGSSGRYQNWEVVDPEKWVPDGYVCVRVDSRGAGRSPGFLDCTSPREAQDLYGCIEWAAAQPWANGKVGLAGISYYAMNQWQVAMLQPPHLAAICPWEGSADYYRDATHHGGILSTFEPNWYLAQVVEIQHGYGERGARDPNTGELVSGPDTLTEDELAANRLDLGHEIRARPFDGDFYRARSVDWSRVRVPLLSCSNWGGQGLHPRGNFEGYTQSASEQKWLECHGDAHWTHFYTDYGRELQKRFFDHFLKGEDNGWDREPPVLLQVRRPGERFEERRESAWPLPSTEWTPLYLDAAAQALSRSAPGEAAGVSYDPAGDGIDFSLPALDAETEVTGPLAAKLFVSSESEDADLFLVVRVFDPEGEEVTFQGTLDPHTPVAQGWLRASHRRLDPERSLPYRPYHPHEEREPLTPGSVYELDIEIWPTCLVVPPGYRIVLTVRGRDYEYEDAATNVGWFVMRGCGAFLHDDPDDRPAESVGGTVTLHTGPDHPSHLLLPVIPE